MQITQQQIVNPGIFDASDEHQEQLRGYKEAVESAVFLNEKEKRHWILLGYILTTGQLLTAQKLILSEDLKYMKIKQALEKIKPSPKGKAN